MTSLDSTVTACDTLNHTVTTTSIIKGKLDSSPSYEGATYSCANINWRYSIEKTFMTPLTFGRSIVRKENALTVANRARIKETFNCRNLRVTHPLTQSVRTSDFLPRFSLIHGALLYTPKHRLWGSTVYTQTHVVTSLANQAPS
jgi:hypothetical protein